MVCVIALQNVIVYAVNLADNIMIGGYSEVSMSGVALVNQLQFLLQMMIIAVGDGIVVIASRYWGEKNFSPIKHVVGTGMQVGLAVTMLLFIAVSIFPNEILSLLSKDQAEVAEGVKYLNIVKFTYPVFCATTVLLSALRSVETVVIGFIDTVVALFVNVGLNYALIYGKFGLPSLGVEGAAIATLIARIVELLVVIIYLTFFDKKIRTGIKAFFTLQKDFYKPFLKVTLPLILSGCSWGVAQTIQTGILGNMEVTSNFSGASVIGANSIAVTIFSIASVFSYGAANASAVIVGKTIGEGRKHKLREYGNTLQILYLVIGVVTGLSLFLLKDGIISLYTSVSPETTRLSELFIIVLSVTVVGTSYQVTCLTGIIRGAGDTKFVLFNDLIFMWGIVLPVSMLAAFVFRLSPVIVFICLKSDQILKCFVAMVKVNRYKWIDKIRDIK